jgi:hypothetical protein
MGELFNPHKENILLLGEINFREKFKTKGGVDWV